jgi:hypothetical protein
MPKMRAKSTIAGGARRNIGAQRQLGKCGSGETGHSQVLQHAAAILATRIGRIDVRQR